ncbi:hypothetical protein J1N35_028142 [Gossypium stocksii]|uniref:Uncharacterized protein n=1 Tax=Gossypium stocksii TaxID=47602 RepID=A0A9D3UVT7_9ROSI|nr:hypothetical protein J1N35_028142 [Gossypium stocksii]
MGFFVTTLIFAVIGVVASLCTRICCDRGPSANLRLVILGNRYSWIFIMILYSLVCYLETREVHFCLIIISCHDSLYFLCTH